MYYLTIVDLNSLWTGHTTIWELFINSKYINRRATARDAYVFIYITQNVHLYAEVVLEVDNIKRPDHVVWTRVGMWKSLCLVYGFMVGIKYEWWPPRILEWNISFLSSKTQIGYHWFQSN